MVKKNCLITFWTNFFLDPDKIILYEENLYTYSNNFFFFSLIFLINSQRFRLSIGWFYCYFRWGSQGIKAAKKKKKKQNKEREK